MLVNGRVDRPAICIMIMPLSTENQRNTILKEFPKLKPEFVPNTFGIFVRPSDTLPKGIKKFDTIIGINGEMVNSGLQFSDEIYKHNIGDTITLVLIRKKVFLKVDIPLKVFPVDDEAMYTTQKPQFRVP